MRDSRVVPPRLRPTMKMGESEEEIGFFERVPSDCVPDNKKSPNAPRLVLTQVLLTKAQCNQVRLQYLVALCSCNLKTALRIAMHQSKCFLVPEVASLTGCDWPSTRRTASSTCGDRFNKLAARYLAISRRWRRQDLVA